MRHIKDFEKENIADYTDEELKNFLNQIAMQRGVLQTQCADEMNQYLKDDGFDVYSFWGRRKVDKISKKYASIFAGADYLEETIKEEMKKREKFNEEQRYTGKSIVKKEQSLEEFLEKEQDKTWAYKSKIE